MVYYLIKKTDDYALVLPTPRDIPRSFFLSKQQIRAFGVYYVYHVDLQNFKVCVAHTTTLKKYVDEHKAFLNFPYGLRPKFVHPLIASVNLVKIMHFKCDGYRALMSAPSYEITNPSFASAISAGMPQLSLETIQEELPTQTPLVSQLDDDAIDACPYELEEQQVQQFLAH